MNIMQIMQLALNPQAALQQFGNNPMFRRAQQMMANKSPEQMRQTVMNVARFA